VKQKLEAVGTAAAGQGNHFRGLGEATKKPGCQVDCVVQLSLGKPLPSGKTKIQVGSLYAGVREQKRGVNHASKKGSKITHQYRWRSLFNDFWHFWPQIGQKKNLGIIRYLNRFSLILGRQIALLSANTACMSGPHNARV